MAFCDKHHKRLYDISDKEWDTLTSVEGWDALTDEQKSDRVTRWVEARRDEWEDIKDDTVRLDYDGHVWFYNED